MVATVRFTPVAPSAPSAVAAMDVVPQGVPPLRRKGRLWLIGGSVLLAGVVAGATIATYWPSRSVGDRAAAETESAPVQIAGERSADPRTTQRASVSAEPCKTCGVVESVRAVQRKGEATGVGAVAGGVVGGALGSQVGRGDGRTAMTVLGAIGGGLAGNEVEKRAKATTVYEVRVRTDDGQTRTFEQNQAWAEGQRVRVDGRRLHAVPAQP